MKFIPFTAAALAAFTGVALAEGGDNPPHFGEKWTGIIGAQIFTDTTVTTLRGDDEIRTAWQAMTEEQRAMVKADCDMAKASGSVPAAATDNTSTGTDSQGSDASGANAGGSNANASGGNSGNGGTDASPTMTPMFVSMDNMTKLCATISP